MLGQTDGLEDGFRSPTRLMVTGPPDQVLGAVATDSSGKPLTGGVEGSGVSARADRNEPQDGAWSMAGMVLT